MPTIEVNKFLNRIKKENLRSVSKNWKGVKYLNYLKRDYLLNYWIDQDSPLFTSESSKDFLEYSLNAKATVWILNALKKRVKVIQKSKKLVTLEFKYQGKLNRVKYKTKIYNQIFAQRTIISRLIDLIADNECTNAEDSFVMNEVVWEVIYEYLLKDREKLRNFQNDRSYQRFQSLKTTFNLTEEELTVIKVLSVCSFAKLTPILDDYAKQIPIDQFVKTLLEVANQSRQKSMRAIREKGSLQRLGIVQISYMRKIELNQVILDYIMGIGDDDLLTTFLRKDSLEDCLPSNILLKDTEKLGIVKKLIKQKKGINILLYGAPGTGKTSLAKSLGKELGKEVYFVNELSKNDQEDASSRKVFVRTADHILDPKKAVLVIDEADQILNTVMSYLNYGTAVDKSWINQFLTENKVPIIWVTNEVRFIEESTLRRFSYSIEFKPKTKEEISEVWKTHIDKFGISSLQDEDVEYLARHYNVSAGAISLAAKNLKLNRKNISKYKLRTQLDEVLSAHQKLIGKDMSNDLNSISPFYSVSHVNASHDLTELIKKVEKFEQAKAKKCSMLNNVNMLLSGPPGCGKSEFVKYLSIKLNKELMIRRSSDILSKWVGGSEANIKAAFQEANQKNAILFIDECDSLLEGRENANRSHEVSRVNEMLTWLENHKTICIMATNFIDNCDQAMMRRFAFKVKLDYLKPEANLHFFQKILIPLTKEKLTQEQTAEIQEIKNLTPGDFKSVYQSYAFETKVKIQKLIDSLKDEVSYKKAVKSIGL